ncbi:excinuclease ABC subunit C [Pontibacter sp. E15-1]|uniref:excinuclease ABC subunit C n=1 Tax=Pontibacter sp. E15-1 TaxID=2919918 RepID=UPI001F4F340B|nr:excinuclease ABC subunit C [Pontibacter sp. E15-1]MCJ8163606.1 excinuclease ABC subunit C [Pontibacter sp. E15-1]
MQASQPRHFYVYIFGKPSREGIQVGIAGNLSQQLQELNSTPDATDTTPQNQIRLVYYEHYDAEEVARNREKEILKGGEDALHRLIASMNPNWLDLSDTLA